MGGYSSSGFAWRFYIPKELLYRASNNLLEHLAMMITVEVEALAGRISKEDCVLSMTDSSTSEGWTRKSNFKIDPVDADCDFDPIEAEVRTDICRHFSELTLDRKFCHYTIWFKGEENDVSDALSRDDDRSDEELTHLLYSHVPEQMPEHFNIVPLPNEIVSWVTCQLQRLPVKEQLREKRKRTKIGRGGDGSSTATLLASPPTSTSTSLKSQTESRSSELSPLHFEKDAFLDRLMKPWQKQLSEVPFHTLHRPLGITTDLTPHEMQMESLEGFYQGYGELLEQKILRKSNKNPSQPLSC
jgi:hypothetical protein